MDKVTRLKNVPLFAALAPEHLAHMSEIATTRTFTQGAFLCKRGEASNTLYIIDSGNVALPQAGAPDSGQPATYLGEGQTIGEAALLFGDEHWCSAQAVTDVEALAIRKEDFDLLRHQHPEIIDQLRPSRHARERLQAPRFPWQEQNEPTVVLRRRHWFALAQSLPVPLLILLGLSIAAWLLRQMNLLTGILATALFVGLVPAAIALWLVLDWHNDFYLVTTKRVLHEERVILLYQTWEEIPLQKVQDTTIRRDFWGKLLGFGTLRIQTASLHGSLVLDYLPDPEYFQASIWQQTKRLGSSARQDQREEIRESLVRQMKGAEAETGPQPMTPPSPPPSWQPEGRVNSLVQLRSLTSRESDNLVWRKHWVFLLRQTFLPVVAFLASTALIVISLLFLSTRYRFPLFIASLLLWVATLVWLWWRIDDWGNDLYIVTDSLIIDIEKKPLFFSEERRQATLDMIQNVSLEKQGLLPALLNYGDVVIQTAGPTGAFTFANVANPTRVQREIFNRVDAYNADKQRRVRQQEKVEISEWFREYHELSQKPEGADS